MHLNYIAGSLLQTYKLEFKNRMKDRNLLLRVSHWRRGSLFLLSHLSYFSVFQYQHFSMLSPFIPILLLTTLTNSMTAVTTLLWIPFPSDSFYTQKWEKKKYVGNQGRRLFNIKSFFNYSMGLSIQLLIDSCSELDGNKVSEFEGILRLHSAYLIILEYMVIYRDGKRAGTVPASYPPV